MSVGGIVTGIDVVKEENRLRIRTRELIHPGDKEVCAEVEDNEETRRIKIGDSFWWHGEYAFWTRNEYNAIFGTEVDKKIKRFSGSYCVPKGL